MKRLFKLGLVALMGICGLVSIGRAQQTFVTVDTTASLAAEGCTLDEATGVWTTQPNDDDEFAPVLKLVNASDTAWYRVSFTAQDADGDDFDFSYYGNTLSFKKGSGESATALTTVMLSEGGLYQLSMKPGEYTVTFTLQSCGRSSAGKDEDYTNVPGADPLTIKVKFPELSFTLTAAPAATDTIDGEDAEGNAIERWVFPTKTAPEFTVGFEGGVPSSITVMGYDKMNPAFNDAPIFQSMLEGLTFTFKPMSDDEGDGDDDSGIATLADEYFPDGDYTILVTDNNTTFNYFYIRIGQPTVWTLTAVGAELESEGPWDSWMQFPTEEAKFSMSVENGPDSWWAVVSIATQEQNAFILETDTIFSTDATKFATFTTLTGGVTYNAQCTVYGADNDVLWTNFNPEMSKFGVDFKITGEILPTDPTLTVEAAGKFTMNDDVIVFDSVATFKMKVTGLAEDDDLANYTITARLYKNDSENPAEIFDEESYDGVDTVATLIGIWNGEYSADFFLTRTSGMKPQELEPVMIDFKVTNYEEPVDPVQISVKAVGNTEEDGKVIFANGENIAFDIFVTELPADDTNYKIDVYIWTKEEAENGAGADATRFNAKDSIRFNAEGVYFNNEYVAKFDLMKYDERRGEFMNAKNTEITFFVTENPTPADPELTVKAVGGTEGEDGKISFADGKAAFDMLVKGVAEDDTTYAFYVTVWNTADEDYFPEPDILNFADSVRFENDFYNGEYEITFELRQLNKRGEYNPVVDQTLTIVVTGGEDRPELTVKPVGNTEKDGKIIFADGNVAFDMFVKGLSVAAGDDSTFMLYVTVYTEDKEDYRLPQEFTYADSVRFVDMYYNGEYEAVFELMRRTPRGTYTNVTAQTIEFSVTENAEPVENYELTVEPVGATKDGENYTFAAAEVAFDIAVKGMTEADKDLLIYAKVYTKKQYDSIDSVGVVSMKAAASVRFNDTLEDGEYVAEFQLMRTTERGDVATNADDVTIHFTVKAEQSANEAGELAGVNVYPNPNAGAFNVAVPERARIDIFGLNGAKVLSREVNAGVEAFNLDHSGIYFVRVMAGNKTAVKRVVVR